MKKYKFTLSIGISNSKQEDVFEFDDDVTKEELEEWYIDWMNNNLDGGWHEVEEDEVDE